MEGTEILQGSSPAPEPGMRCGTQSFLTGVDGEEGDRKSRSCPLDYQELLELSGLLSPSAGPMTAIRIPFSYHKMAPQQRETGFQTAVGSHFQKRQPLLKNLMEEKFKRTWPLNSHNILPFPTPHTSHMYISCYVYRKSINPGPPRPRSYHKGDLSAPEGQRAGIRDQNKR